MRRGRTTATLAAVALAVALGGCSGSMLGDRLPADLGGEPVDAPARPANPYLFPAVHDMPPPRPDQPLSEEQQVQMEKDLEKVRDRQETQAAGTDEKPGKKTAKSTKKPVAEANGSQVGGGKPNP